ncbi:Transposase IS200 like protein [compost metagenome]|jgi:REP element-mobilizing transposase RayT
MRYQGRNLRKGRLSEPGRIYLLTTVTHKRAPLFAHWENACVVAREIHAMQDPARLETLAWVLMPDHLHWLVRLNSGALGEHVRRMKSRSAIGVNKLRNNSGRFWQQGFHDHALRREEDLKDVARYIVANPLRAGLVKKLADYPFWNAVWL